MANENPLRITEHISLEEREIENIAPREIIERAVNNKSFFDLIDLNVIEEENHWNYIDFKEGVSNEWLSKQDVPTQNYWRKAQKHINNKIKACAFCHSTGIVEAKTKGEKDKPCDCTIIHGLGNDVLSKIIIDLEEKTINLNLKKMAADERWLQIAKVIFDYSVAPKARERVR